MSCCPSQMLNAFCIFFLINALDHVTSFLRKESSFSIFIIQVRWKTQVIKRHLNLWSNTDACIDILIVLSFRYNGHYFVTTLIYSVLLGFLGMDRFCLGHTGTAVGKLLTLGGVGIWWIVDIVLLVNGMLTPDDGSNWVPYY